MQIEGLTPEQVAIANYLWAAQTLVEVEAIVSRFGPIAATIKEMIVAAAFDEETNNQTSFPEVMKILEAVR